jgi:hypothetical protein
MANLIKRTAERAGAKAELREKLSGVLPMVKPDQRAELLADPSGWVDRLAAAADRIEADHARLLGEYQTAHDRVAKMGGHAAELARLGLREMGFTIAHDESDQLETLGKAYLSHGNWTWRMKATIQALREKTHATLGNTLTLPRNLCRHPQVFRLLVDADDPR